MPVTKKASELVGRALVTVYVLWHRGKFQLVYLFRRFVLPKDPEDVDYLVAKDTDPEELREILFSAGLVKGDIASYYYFEEDLNMVRGLYRDDSYEWYQYHIRGFDTADGVRLRPHVELYWRTYPAKHIDTDELSVDDGIEITERILDEDERNIEYERVSVE